ncbi:hypothetical protein M404DRAFT_753289 [Pisolithus tinctorius Marx 270]|uniref:Uncharacterized protein n=1 Tax=Pisolithus tinctorius Marx 270 TaxID=870435 RepID=A0A0C3JTP5_PISTI|nr:hypothetical protein M404DRAFT_753289 [Pisolithus tinctorius Marx 270]
MYVDGVKGNEVGGDRNNTPNIQLHRHLHLPTTVVSSTIESSQDTSQPVPAYLEVFVALFTNAARNNNRTWRILLPPQA